VTGKVEREILEAAEIVDVKSLDHDCSTALRELHAESLPEGNSIATPSDHPVDRCN
jgi:hypothetical protein